MLHSARDKEEFAVTLERFARLREVFVTQRACLDAVSALEALAEVSPGYHRVGLADALIAASAREGIDGVVHYNHDFDRLAEVLPFASVWLADPPAFENPAGTPPASS